MSELVANNRIDGVILTPPLTDNPEVLDFLEARGIRYSRVAPSSFPDRSPGVKMDDYKAGGEIATLFWKAGHRKFGLLNGPVAHGASHSRRNGYLTD